jgi:hypothetical protein
MKYRVEVDIAFANESNAKGFLNQVENIKSTAYVPTGNEPIPLYRKAEYGEELYDYSEMIIADSVNFDGEIVEH